MNIEKAIKKAIDGGWERKPNTAIDLNKDMFLQGLTREKDWKKWRGNTLLLGILDDPSIWRSLGNASGWNQGELAVCDKCGERKAIDCFCTDAGTIEEWLWHWHRFIDNLADGISAEEFFGELV